MTDEVDVADVDAQFQRRRGHQCPQLTPLEARFGVEPQLLRHAAMVGSYLVRAEPLGKVAGETLGMPARVDENERSAMLGDQLGQPVIHLRPDFAGHDGLERRGGHFDGEVAVADVACIHNGALGPPVGTDVPGTDQEARDYLDRLLGCRQADAGQSASGQRFQPFQGQGEVQAALASNHRMDLVDDDGTRGCQHLPTRLRAEQDVERLGSGHDDVGRPLPHPVAFVLRGVAGADEGSNVDIRQVKKTQLLANRRERCFEIEPDIVRQRFQRRDVNDVRLVGQAGADSCAHQAVDRGQECRQCLA